MLEGMNPDRMGLGEELIGQRVRRLEDPPLLVGRGTYAGDPRLEGLLHMAVYRSPLAHARVRSLDLTAVRQASGVVAAWSAADLPELAGGLGDPGARGRSSHPRPVLGREVARYQGEPLAVVVARSPYEAADALSLVEADLEQLPAAPTLELALAEGAPLVHEDLESNVAGVLHRGFGDAEAAFAGAGVTVSATFELPRICGGYMEPRTVTGEWRDGTLTLWCSTQWTFGVRDRVAELLGLDKEKVRVLAPDVGGGFGPKGEVYPEEVLVAAAVVRLGRPVRWVASRSEDTSATAHAHGTRISAELAADHDGTLRGLRALIVHDVGAYTASGAGQPEIMLAHMISVYRLPALSVKAQLVHTNTVPTGFVRGGGRPVGNFVVERLMDFLAHRLGLDPVEVRRRNLIHPQQMPYDTGLPSGRETVVYDGGDYPRLLAVVEEALAGVREGPRPDARLVGRGIACCVEATGFGRREPGRVRLEKDGRVRLFVGSTPQGQGHRTMAAQVLGARLGWPLEKIEVTAGDTGVVDWALLTAGSRSTVQVGNAAAAAGTSLRRLLLERAAEVLEADPADLVLEDGRVFVRGAPSKAVSALEAVPPEGLEVWEHFDPAAPLTYSSGCHGAVVSVDPETGWVDVERYVIAHDTGRVVNPTLLEGQLHGGLLHGLGYALYEEAAYTEDGQLATATFLDYSVPSISEAVRPQLRGLGTPTQTNPEGFKGVGESGTIPVPAAIAAAVERALRHLNPSVVVTRLPLTPERVRQLARG